MTEDTLINEIEKLHAQAIIDIQTSTSKETLETWRVSYLGRKSELTNILRGLSSLDIEHISTKVLLKSCGVNLFIPASLHIPSNLHLNCEMALVPSLLGKTYFREAVPPKS